MALVDAERLPDSTHVGRVRLAVSRLERSIAFYRDVIGLAVLSKDGKLVRLGAHDSDAVLLELEELPFVQPVRERSRLGLYHTAFLLPSRADLSRFVRHLWASGVGFAAGDHAVSESLYLVDPDGLEVEVTADRAREEWTWQGGELRMGVWAVELPELAALTANSGTVWQGASAGTTVGHVHLYVGNLRFAETFYCAGLGLDIVVRIPSALFVSAGGYHHHVGLNIWAAGSPVASETDARMIFWEMILPDTDEVARVAARLTKAGYVETVSAAGARAFVDDVDITVALVVERG